MAEYINRDAFLEQQRAWYCKDCNRRKNSKGKTVYEIGEAPCRACDIGTMLDAVEDYPAADVVEVVRCKDCIYSPSGDDSGDDKGFSLEWPHDDWPEDNPCPCKCDDGWYSIKPTQEFYCAYGKRKAGTWCADYDYAEYDFDGSTPLPEPPKEET